MKKLLKRDLMNVYYTLKCQLNNQVLKKQDINLVLLTGGCSTIPKFKAMIKREFRKSEIIEMENVS